MDTTIVSTKSVRILMRFSSQCSFAPLPAVPANELFPSRGYSKDDAGQSGHSFKWRRDHDGAPPFRTWCWKRWIRSSPSLILAWARFSAC